MEAVALTDHGRAGGLLQFKKACDKHGVRPIYGVELYMCPPHISRTAMEKFDGYKTSYHLVALAKNEEGLKNIFRLTSIGWLDGFYYKPRVDVEALRTYSEGLIILSGCAGGFIPNMLMEEREEEAIEFGHIMQDIFGDDFYIEVQDHGIDWQKPLKYKLFDFATKNGYKTVATQDSHFINKEDADLHAKICKLAAGDLEFESKELYFKTYDEMCERIEPQHRHALDMTKEIADKCNVNWNFGDTIWPVYELDGITPYEELQRKTEEGFQEKILGTIPEDKYEEYRERVKYELGVINRMGFSTYFLVVADFIRWAIKNKIPVGPGRGSGSGSIVCYCLGITKVEPIKYGLYFERFLNPARVSLPDIDVDFCPKGRKNVMQYVSEKYGTERVAQIGTYAAFKPRGSLRDFSRVCGHGPQIGDSLANLVPANIAGFSLSFDEVIKARPQLLEVEQQEVVDLARRAEGLKTKMGVHAAGVVISDRPLMEQLPLFRGKHDEIATQFDMHDVEDLGLVKYDFLGLINLTIINDTVDLIKKIRGIDVKIIEEDQEVFKEIFQTGNLDGVFQFETSSGFRDLCVKVKPTNIKDLSDITALFRPGPLETGLTNKYIEGRRGAKVDYPTQKLEPILNETYGVMVYQEQIMKICVDLAGYTASEADDMRKAIGKKLTDKMAQHKDKFIQGCIKNNIDQIIAENMFNDIEGFARYSFNKCLTEDTEVRTETGKTISIKEIKEKLRNHKVMLQSYDINKDKVVEDECVEVIDAGNQEVYLITLTNGKEIKCTLDHKILCDDKKMHTVKEIIDLDLNLFSCDRKKKRCH
jgi:DNA polymerase-3 subunit alpha